MLIVRLDRTVDCNDERMTKMLTVMADRATGVDCNG